MLKQRFVNGSFPNPANIVGMNDNTDQAMLFHDHVDLLLPQIDGIVIENVEQGVILSGGDRQLQNLTHEERHDGAAPSALRVQMRDIGHRHVVRELQGVKPLLPSIQNRSSKSGSAKSPLISVDFECAPLKLVLVAKQLSVVI